MTGTLLLVVVADRRYDTVGNAVAHIPTTTLSIRIRKQNVATCQNGYLHTGGHHASRHFQGYFAQASLDIS